MRNIDIVKNKLREQVKEKDFSSTKTWMETFTGTKFYPMKAEVEDIRIEDIAHSLANICRWGGHTKFHFSVASHSVMLSKLVPPRYALEALLHDATEAYLGDIPTPIKKTLPLYEKAEQKLAQAIYKHYKLQYPFPKEVEVFDDVCKQIEYHNLLEDGVKTDEVLVPKITPKQSKEEFIKRFNQLMEKRNEGK